MVAFYCALGLGILIARMIWIDGRERSARQRILGALTAGPLSGFEIAKAAKISAGTLYVQLKLLEDQGDIIGEWAPGPSPRRRIYSLRALSPNPGDRS